VTGCSVEGRLAVPHTLIRVEEPPSLREQVVSALRPEIVAGRAGAETIYTVPGVAGRLGVSTTPVREALLELTRAGLLEPLRNRGFRVVDHTLADLDNLFELRVLLEVEAADRVAAQAPAKLTALHPLADAVRVAVAAGDVESYLETDRAFHTAFVELAGNPRLTELVLSLRDNMRLYGIDTPAGVERQQASVEEHFRMLELAAAGDRAAIKPLMRQHIVTWRPVFAAALEERQQSQR